MELDDRVTIATPEGLRLHLQLAGLGSRFIAVSVDLVLEVIIIAVIGFIMDSVVGGAVAAAVTAVSAFSVLYFYNVLFEVLGGGRTPGKRLSHLRVLRDDGTPVDLPASAIRNLLRLVDLLFAGLPALFSILLTKRNQRLGDIAAGTLVIREAPQPARAPVAVPSAAAGAPALATSSGVAKADAPATPLDVSAVTAEEVAAVRRFLARRDELERDARQRLAYRLEAGLRAKVSGAPEHHNPERFLEALVAAKARV